MRLDVEAARRAVEARVARPMGLGVTEAAWGIHRVVNENMAGAARVHGIERGKDLRGYPLFAFGGAGPVHAWQVGRILRVPQVIVPYGAGALSAYGLLAAPLAFDFVRTAPQRLTTADWALVNRLFEEMEAEGRRILRGAGVPDGEVTVRRSAEMRYFGQGHEVDVEIPSRTLGPDSLPTITASFEAAYRLLYSRTPMGVPLEALNWRAVISGPPPDLTITSGLGSGTAAAAAPTPKKHRAAYFPEAGGYVQTPVYDRYGLQPGARLAGPAIVEERESTSVIGPGALISVDAHRNLVAEPASGGAR